MSTMTTTPRPTIYVDLDGTLLGHQASLLHDAQGGRSNVGIDALAKAEHHNADVVIATGRDKYRASEFARAAGITKFIAELGCVVNTTGEEILEVGDVAQRFIDDNSLSHAEFINAVSDAAHMLISHFPKELEMHAPYNRDRHASLLLRGNVSSSTANELLHANGWPFLDLVANGHGMFRRTMPHVENVLIYHLTPIGVTKASGIIRDQKLRGLDKDHCYMIGDGMADAECVDAVHTVFMPSNGPASDPNVADFAQNHSSIHVLEKSHNEGFAEAINIILSKY
jgi:hydroxymethylpyrimidine pyrophosphatase-like HAD family hydrolase